MIKRMKWECLFILAMLPFTVTAGEENCSKWSKLDTSGACVIPLIRAIVSPADVDDRYIRLSGVMSFEYERNILYMDSFSYKEQIYENGINLSITVGNLAPFEHFNGDVVKSMGILGSHNLDNTL